MTDLHWAKMADPEAAAPLLSAGVDARVLMPMHPRFDKLCLRLSDAGIPFRQVRYWLEAETISTADPPGELRAQAQLCPLTTPSGHQPRARAGHAARDAFAVQWDTHDGPLDMAWEPVDAARLVPEAWLPYLPFRTLNPTQAEAAPKIIGAARHLVVTAPTGSGKTVIGMIAALKAILGEGRKAAWLVPQRSLTDELDRELETWRAAGLRVERLSGEYATDVEKVREADLWVATTEKFEAMCRASSMRAALAEVGCLVVDEIHLLGDRVRGPLLEALLARVRGTDSPVRLVGLSATVANAGEIARWLDAEPVHTSWRPSRLTWQLPVIPASGNRFADQAHRTKLAVAITRMITEDEGSVLVFCGSKRGVRSTALAIAASRGAVTADVDPDDLDRVHQVCESARVGVHYKDWEHKHRAESRFRDRELDVLVATTTVAAGVNLPARAVVVRDTKIGIGEIDVATVQQMFGRAGRIGAGEREGWAYLIVDETEHAEWQERLVAGYTVRSRIADELADHVLAEAALDRIHTRADAEEWWLNTLAHHQGDLAPLHEALDFLVREGFLTESLAVTDLGYLTTRLMVPVEVGAQLRATLSTLEPPGAPEDAENALISAVAEQVPTLADAPIPEELRPTVARLARSRGGLAGPVCQPGDLARVALSLAAFTPHVFLRLGRVISGLPTALLLPLLAEAPRYLAWLGAQGFIRTIHPWVAIVAADLSRRVRWRACAPGRGSGRLLWMCEWMATPPHAEALVPGMFSAASRHGVTSPDWPVGGRPSGCRLDDDGYAALLRDRATDMPPDAAVHTLADGQAVFTRRGDYRATGWLAAYSPP